MDRGFKVLFGLFLIGLSGYFGAGTSWSRYIFAHLAGFAILGIIAWWGGKTAQKKGYKFKQVFWWSLLLPILSGFTGVLIVRVFGGDGCGGVISLLSILIILGFSKVIMPYKGGS